MSERVALLFGVHAHQPVGNFPAVMHEAFERCYGPYIETLARYPEFRCAFHISGWLFEWLLQHYPAAMAQLRAMAQRGQVELFGAGYSEPVLAAIPARDRVGQVQHLVRLIERWSGTPPQGAWLTERVWEATVVPSLAQAGVRYVTVDDYHFLCTGRGHGELTGYFTTEEDERRIDLFPISEQLRYRFPFAVAKDAVAYVESLAAAGQPCAVYFDDIEKFGIWPETYAWVYEKRWLEQFIEGVLASKRIDSMLFRDYHAAHATRGIVYLPTCSYREMNEWTLPANAAQTYTEVEHLLKRHTLHETGKAYVRGGIWRNFFSLYAESNWMHKRMLALSARVDGLPAAARAQQGEQLTNLLYQAQANDAYWHGLFGGLYLPHLRRAVWNALIELEERLDRIAPRPSHFEHDLDNDGAVEIVLCNAELQIVLAGDGSGALRELDSYALKHNFCDTLRRYQENYHARARQGEAGGSHAGEGIASAHDRVMFKHMIEAADMVPDCEPRFALQEFLPERESCLRYEKMESSAAGVVMRTELDDAVLQKTIALRGAGVNAAYLSSRPLELDVRLNLALPSCDGPAGRYWLDGRCPGGFGQPLWAPAARELTLEDDVLGGCLVLNTSTPVDIAARAHHSVSQSEAGFEKIMQCVEVTVHASLRAGESFELSLRAIQKSG